MRTLPAGLQAHLDSGATTLCHCWRLETLSGDVMGFTDHDADLSFDGVSFEAAAGFTASEMESSLGFAADNLEASGALRSHRLSAERLAAGDFDNAAVEIWLVNWQDTAQRLLLRKGRLGDVTRGDVHFTAELRGLADALNQPKGRIFQFGCDAVVGDGRCGVNLDDPAFSITVAVMSAAEDRRLTVPGADGFEAGWFARGVATFQTGSNAGRKAGIKFHREGGAGTVIELWQPMPSPVSAGDMVRLTAGCDKQFATCRDKFANGINFRGFPHIPGDDFVLGYASRDEDRNDGSSRNGGA